VIDVGDDGEVSKVGSRSGVGHGDTFAFRPAVRATRDCCQM
jgi:hypothetical protein